jgi:hypothetical protein
MKKFLLLFTLFLSSVLFAQTNGITYQAILYKPNGDVMPGHNNSTIPLALKNVCIQFTIVDASNQNEYVETVTVTTDQYGMVNLIIGTGNQTGGYASDFASVDWTSNQKSLRVGLNITGVCSNFEEISNQPFSIVPFAYSSQYATSAVSVTGIVPIENGGTNASTVVGAKTNLGLDLVDNTSDLAKPISTATQSALNLKENAVNKSTDVTLADATNVKFPTELAVKTFVNGQVVSNTTALNAAITAVQDDVNANEIATTNALALKEDAVNKSTDVTLADVSNTKFPTELAVKTFVNGQVVSNTTALNAAITAVQDDVNANETATTNALALKENAVNKSTDVTLADVTNTKFPTERAVKTFVNGQIVSNTTTLNAAITAVQDDVNANETATTNALALKENAVNKSTDVTLADVTNTKFPTERAVKTFVNGQIVSNTTTLNAAITAVQDDVNANEIATTNALALKENAVNKSTDVTLADVSNTKFPTELAVKTFVTNQIATGTATNVSGIVAIANGGTGSSVQNFVDLTNNQNIAGTKLFNSDIVVNGIKVGNGGGSQSTVLGDSANATQSNNTALGFMVLDGNSGTDNTAIGTNSMRNSGATSMNTSIGENSGTGVNTGNGNTYVGYNANVTDNSAISNATAIGANAVVASSNTIQLGNTSTTDIKTSGKITTGNITLPNTDGTSGQVLTTNGTGIIDWSSPATITISPINGNSDVYGAIINNGALSLTPADATNGGIVTTGTQTFAGDKTVVGNLIVSSATYSAILDQSHSVSYGIYGAGQSALGQSFTAGLSGSLNKVSMRFANSTCTGTLKIFSGSGVSGTLLTSQAFSISSGNGDIEFTLNSPITVVNGTQYTMLFEKSTGNIDVYNSNDGSYTGGQAYAWGGLQSNLDNVFKTYVSTVSGGNITAAGTITAGSVTYPNTHGTANQVLTTNGSGTLSWSNPSGSASSLTGMVTSNGNVTTVVTNANLTGAITSSGNATSLGSFTSSEIATALTDETGTGTVVLSDSPTLSGVPLAPTPSNTTDTNQIATTAFIQDLLLNAPASSSALSGAIWTSATTGTLNGISFTLTNSRSSSISSWDLSDTNFSSAPLSINQDMGEIAHGDDWVITFAAPISNLKLYLKYWRTASYVFDQPLSILSGTGFTSPNSNTISLSGWGNGIIEFIGPITTLSVNSSASLVNDASGQLVTFGGQTSSPSSSGSGQVIRVDSPNLEGIPTAPTATAGTNTTQIATTAFVSDALSSVAQNFVDMSSNQTVAGNKTFSSDITVNGLTIGKGIGQVNDQNITVGENTLVDNTTGQLLIAIGNGSLYSNTSANYNIGIGASTLSNNQTGENNIAIGVASLNSNTGANNTAIGRSASQLGAANSNITSLGFQAGMRNTGNSNTFLGTNTDQNSPSSSITNSTALGFGAKISAANQIQLGNTSVTNVNTSGSYTGTGFKTPTGTSSQYLMADGSVSSGSSSSSGVPYTGATGSVDLGTYDLKVNGLTVGIGAGAQPSNVVLGKSAMENNSIGGYSVAVGFEALKSITNGNSNTAVGFQALKSNTTGGANIAIGMNALLNNINGSQNIAIGQSTLNNNTSASGNTVIGHSAGVNISTGGSNTIIGQEAAGGLTTGSWNTIIGRNAYTGNISNNIVLSNGQGAIKAQHDGTNWTLSGTTTATGFKTPSGTSSQYLMADGSVSSGSSSSGVPYSGATAAVDLGDYNLTVNGLTIGSNGTSMMGDSYSSTVVGNQATIGTGYSAASESSAFGYKASATGPQSIAIGSEASANQTQGISIGYHASVGTGYGFAIGSYSQSNGMHSAALGPFSQTSGNYSVALGYQANASAENSIAIGKDANVSTANTIQLGNTSVTNVNTSGNITTAGSLLLGNLTSAQIAALTPSPGQLVYNITTGKFQGYAQSTSTGSPATLSNNASSPVGLGVSYDYNVCQTFTPTAEWVISSINIYGTNLTNGNMTLKVYSGVPGSGVLIGSSTMPSQNTNAGILAFNYNSITIPAGSCYWMLSADNTAEFAISRLNTFNDGVNETFTALRNDNSVIVTIPSYSLGFVLNYAPIVIGTNWINLH